MPQRGSSVQGYLLFIDNAAREHAVTSNKVTIAHVAGGGGNAVCIYLCILAEQRAAGI